MSLVGNLEDLGLGDILQIVSLSRKSGVLLLQSQSREGKIIFLNGQVIRATSSAFRENIGDLLIRRGLAEVDTVRQAVLLQKNEYPEQRLGGILVDHFGVAKDSIESLVKEQVEKIVYSFFAWSEGTFSFELGESGEVGATNFDPLQFMLDQGLNPQWLAMEGSRILDEKRHRGESLEFEEQNHGPLLNYEEILGIAATSPAGTAPPTSDGTGAVPALDDRGRILLVDDDEATRVVLDRILTGHGFAVQSYAGAAEFVEGIEQAVSAGATPLLLIDLFMPRRDGSGILGGLELLEGVRERFPLLPVHVLSDHPNDDAERRVKQFGIPSVISKPKKSEVREMRGVQALEQLAERLVASIGHDDTSTAFESAGSGSATINLGAELMRELGESAPDQRSNRGPETPGLYLLRGMLQELNNPGLGGGITLLVLRFASELMNRAVIFLAKEDEIVGLGQFGIESSEELADVRVRRMKIPRGQETVFEQVLGSMLPLKCALGSGHWDRYLAEQLGGGMPREIFLGPLVSEGKVVAVLYGDNLPEARPIGDTESLEIFLSQAGLAMEKALLERRLRGREAAV